MESPFETSKKKLFEKLYGLGESKPAQLASSLVHKPAAWLMAAPFRGLVGAGKNVMFGTKGMIPGTTTFGKRQRAIPGMEVGKGVAQVTPDEAAKIRSGKTFGKVYEGNIGGKKSLFKRKYRYGGLTGFAQKHPYITGGGALLAYYLSKDPSARAAAGAMIPRMPQNMPTKDVQMQFGQPSYESPFAKDVWG